LAHTLGGRALVADLRPLALDLGHTVFHRAGRGGAGGGDRHQQAQGEGAHRAEGQFVHEVTLYRLRG
jgi:hypothetical protein